MLLPKIFLTDGRHMRRKNTEGKILYNVFGKSGSVKLAMSTSAPILSANFTHAMAAGHAEDFQI